MHELRKATIPAEGRLVSECRYRSVVKTDSIERHRPSARPCRDRACKHATLPPRRTAVTGRNHPRVPNVVSRSRKAVRLPSTERLVRCRSSRAGPCGALRRTRRSASASTTSGDRPRLRATSSACRSTMALPLLEPARVLAVSRTRLRRQSRRPRRRHL